MSSKANQNELSKLNQEESNNNICLPFYRSCVKTTKKHSFIKEVYNYVLPVSVTINLNEKIRVYTFERPSIVQNANGDHANQQNFDPLVLNLNI